MAMTCVGLSHQGQLRPHNEDAFLADVDRGLLAVADGMGGHAAGEVASRVAIEAVSRVFSEPPADSSKLPDLLRLAVEEANRGIATEIEKQPEFRGMGTTLVVAVADEPRCLIAHVGDSRAYLIREGRIQQLTVDHSLVTELVRMGVMSREQAAHDPRRNVVTRALGSGGVVQPDIHEERVAAGDLLLLCSDGLNTMLPDEKILEILGDATDLEACSQALVQAANAAGGEDNITVVLARF